ncbi:hypothetical protein [Polyangium spumosum]|uniref:DUF4178 domain-containing protein n=1 Tax=Polyangium spumosum TaxID=889282 RepID=A0A6N7PS71_9BACT|nr:hypothetical protein [Polyangium spumosum]MRG95022.1 hypothetical protein [Polyangium spumosum]
MSLVAIAITAAVAASLGYLASRRREREAPDEGKALDDKKKPPRALKAPAPADPLAGLTLALGDVVSAEGDERWLSGAIVAREQALAAVIFVAPEGLAHHVVVLFPGDARRVLWLSPASVDTPPEPPGTLEIRGMAMQRRSRLPVMFERLGQGTPMVGASGILATYEAGGREVALVVTSEGKTLAWAGRRLDEDEYDRMGRADDAS